MSHIAEQALGEPAPLGEPVEFTKAATPQPTEHRGRLTVLRPIRPGTDTAPLYAASHPPDGDPSIWTYLYEGPFPDIDSFRTHLDHQAASSDPLFFAITRASDGEPLGVLSLMAIVPEHGSIEIGHVWFGPQLRRTPLATEAVFLVARHVFDELGYRRLEWKCNALNAASRNAALRFGFQFEGIFHQHRVVKGRNRDTAWFAITDARWPSVRAGFEAWLSPGNFDPDGSQLSSLRELTASERSGL
jgi:RimJ/RimL family protein N-acetyltransferase